MAVSPDNFMQSDAAVTNRFSITYTGQLYQGKRDPSMLFEVLQTLISEGILSRRDIVVHFYSPPGPMVAPSYCTLWSDRHKSNPPAQRRGMKHFAFRVDRKYSCFSHGQIQRNWTTHRKGL